MALASRAVTARGFTRSILAWMRIFPNVWMLRQEYRTPHSVQIPARCGRDSASSRCRTGAPDGRLHSAMALPRLAKTNTRLLPLCGRLVASHVRKAGMLDQRLELFLILREWNPESKDSP